MSKKSKVMIINVVVGLIFLIIIFAFYSTFSLEDGYKIESIVYNIEDNYISDISPNTGIELFKKYFDIENCYIKVMDNNNNEVTNGYVFNGSKTVVYNNNHNVVSSYVNVVKGDINGDGVIDSNDFYIMGKNLINNTISEEYLQKSVDIDNDGSFKINDLVLLDNAVSNGYTGIRLDDEIKVLQTNETGRIKAIVSPSYGVNGNIKWTSLDNSIASVDEAGVITGHNEGEVVIQARTLDDKFMAEGRVKVDNTIRLDSNEGVGYVGGNDVVVGIKAVSYDDLTCEVSSNEVAECSIRDKKLILKTKNTGSVTVSVNSNKYKGTSYKFEVYSVYLNIMPKYLCTTPNNVNFITISSFRGGKLSYEIDDTEIVKSAYMELVNNRNMLRINAGSKQGRTNLKVTESNGNTSNTVVVDVSYMTLGDIGKVLKVGEEVSVPISGNLEILSCKSDNEAVGSCRIEDNNLIVSALSKGSATIKVYNKVDYNGSIYNCGETPFMIVVQE